MCGSSVAVCIAFVGVHPLHVFKPLKLIPRSSNRVALAPQFRRSISPAQPHVSVVHAALPLPNDDIDWVIIDVLSEDVPSSQISEELMEAVQDDAKSLIRTALRDASAELSVVLCSDAYIRKLNAQWRGKDAATDVLSFPQDDPDRVVLGDIVISVDTASRQAEERQLQFRDEIRILLVHGVLHLLGYDHEGKKDGDWLIVCPDFLY